MRILVNTKEIWKNKNEKQYGCHSARLDFRNVVLGDEDPKLNKSILILHNKDKIGFSFVFFLISFVFTKIRVQVLILQYKAWFLFYLLCIAHTQLGFYGPINHPQSCIFGTPYAAFIISNLNIYQDWKYARHIIPEVCPYNKEIWEQFSKVHRSVPAPAWS